MLLHQVLRCYIKVVPLESKAALNTDATGNKVCITVREGAGIPTHEEICPVLRRRLLVTCTVDGAAPCTSSGTAG